MKNLFLLLIISTFSSCTYFNLAELDEAKKEAAKECHFQVEQTVITSCQKGVSFFTFVGLSSPEISGNEEKIKAAIIDFSRKANLKCAAKYGDHDRALVACDIGVKIAADNARQLFLAVRGETREALTSELAVNENIENIMLQHVAPVEKNNDLRDVTSI